MGRADWRGMAELKSLFEALPADAEAAIKEVLPAAADAILAIERGAVPVRTGDLFHGLGVQHLAGGLKVRVGLTATDAGSDASFRKTQRDGQARYSYANLFYGRVVEFGRHAQTVLVQRRRRVGGRLRSSRGRKIAADLAATYTMKVSSTVARPFVDTAQTESVQLATIEQIANIVQNKIGG
jgi:hypothetical protein